jgi:hypothetical protein
MFQNRNAIFKYFLPLFILVILFQTLLAFADDIAVTATVDKTEATLEDSITLSIKVSGTQNSPAPQLPSMPEFRVQSLGTSSSVQIINLKMASSVTFNFRMTPTKKGVFMIQPITINIDGKTLATEPITLSIKESSSKPADQTAPVFVQSTVSNDKPYINEQVTLTLKLFRRVDVRNINLNANYDNFRKEDLGKEKEYIQAINGINYNVLELSVALFPTKTGNLVIPPAVLDLDVLQRTREHRSTNDPFAHFFDDSFLFGGRVQTEHKSLQTNPITLKVQQLPDAGKPLNFSNLLGQFTIGAEITKDRIEMGDSTTLNVKISGKGNVKDIPEPKLDLQDNFKIYPDQPEFKQEIEGNKIAGRKTFKFALLPLHEGKTIISPIPLTYFDPGQKKYVTVQTQPLVIQTNPTKTSESLNLTKADTPKQESIKVIGKDILPIHTHISDFNNEPFKQPHLVLYAGSLLLPALLFFMSTFYLQYRRRLQFDLAYSRRRTAYKLARENLKNLGSSQIPSTKELAKELSRILREYIGNKFNLHGTAYTPLEMTQILKKMHYQENLVQSVTQLLEKFENLQYSQAQPNGDLPDVLLNESSNILEQIEKQP